MPAQDLERRSTSTPFVLLWAGVGLAPVAGVILAVGSTGGLLKAGGVLAMVAVVLVGSGTLLSRAGRAGGDTEEYVAEELSVLRDDIRGDITHAAKATHRVLSEKIVALSDTVEALRGQMEVLRAHVERGQFGTPPAPAAASAAAGVLRHTETVQVTTRQTTFDAESGKGYGERGTAYGDRGTAYGERGTAYGDRGAAYSPAAVTDPGYVPAPATAPVPPSTVPGQRRDGVGVGVGTYGARAAGRAGATGRAAATGWESGTGPEGYPARDSREAYPVRDSGEVYPARDGRAAGYGGREPESSGWTSLPPAGSSEQRAGDRWTSARADSGGRELHVGERRAELRSDPSGSELHTQDRWSSTVQRTAADSGSHRRAGAGGSWPAFGETTQPRAGGGRPALPSSPSGDPAPGWSTGRVEPETARPRLPAEPRIADTGYGTEYGRRARRDEEDRR
jgi:hypothetical protein